MNKFLKVFFIAASVLWLAFIFSNSLKNARSSADQSGSVTRIVADVIASVAPEKEINIEDLSVKIRKTAHYTEFFILSALVSVSVLLFTDKIPRLCAVTLPVCAVSCVSDELLQLASPGRACSPVDMLIDYAGVLTAFFIIIAAVIIRQRRSSLKGESTDK